MIRANVAIAIALVACGETRQRTQDAGFFADAPIDTLQPPTADAPPGAVTITVTERGIALADAAVYFQNADSSVVLAVVTDANGTAGAVMPPGGFVTVIRPRIGTERVDISTFAAVGSGDALHLDLDAIDADFEELVKITVDADPNPAAVSYLVFTSCGVIPIGPPNAQVDGTLFGCNGTADMLVVSLDEHDNRLGAHFHPNQAVTGALALTGIYEPFVPRDVRITNIPPAIGFVGTYQAVTTARGIVIDTSNGARPGAGTATVAIAQPDAAIGSTTLIGTAAIPARSEPGTQVILDRVPFATSYAIDLAGSMLPAYTSAGAYDLATHSITWTEAAAAAQPNVVRAQLRAYRDDIPEGRAWAWRVVAPRAGQSVAFPRLPVDAFDYNPAPGDIVTVGELTTAKVPGGFDGVRARGFEDFKRLVGGQVVVQDLTALEPQLLPARRTARRR